MTEHDRHDECRSILNMMRGDYAEALLAGIEDEKAYDAMVAVLTKQYHAGNLGGDQLIQLLTFATRRLAIKKIADRYADEHPLVMHTVN